MQTPNEHLEKIKDMIAAAYGATTMLTGERAPLAPDDELMEEIIYCCSAAIVAVKKLDGGQAAYKSSMERLKAELKRRGLEVPDAKT